MGILGRRKPKSAQDAFADELIAMIRQLLRYPVDKQDGFALTINRPSGPVTMNLQNIYAEARDLTGDARRRRLTTAVLAMDPGDRPTVWEEAAPRLLPAVRAASWVAAGATADPLRRPMFPFVALMTAIDSEHAIAYATSEDLRRWGVDQETAERRAADNLAALPLPVGQGDGVQLVLGPDGYTSSWLAVPGVLARASEDLGPMVIALAPARDDLRLVDASDPDRLTREIESALAAYEAAPRRLSPVPYQLGADGLAVWDPPQAHPAHRITQRAQRVLAMVEYQNQNAVLQDLFGKVGEDVFVAKYTLMQRDDGSVWSWAAWVKQVTNALVPRTDVLLLGDNDDADAKFCVRWADAIEVGGGALREETGYEPRLWRYSGWPDPATITELRTRAVPFPPPPE